ncbi:9591_t:CDS:2 [Gigaspora margarita]|uniref:9591_t:CDS:1 n=1 Tax=Gigaspora margarita TaxID=4874 RepID=A0ABN7URH7_GIGMA|nr:9591_t:CDS:2 [Gigaspora margarita]
MSMRNPETTTAKTPKSATVESKAMEECISRILELHQSINTSLGKYRTRIYRQDYNMNPQTRKKSTANLFLVRCI